MRAPKYRNRKTIVDGITFDSAREAERYRGLKILERAGHISDLRLQVKYELTPAKRRDDGKMERASHYIADFEYIENGRKVTEDSKGVRTPLYVQKRKHMLDKYGITIREV